MIHPKKFHGSHSIKSREGYQLSRREAPHTFLMRLSIKSMANTWPAVLASSPVNRPIPAPSSMIDLPLKGGSKDRICTTVSILSNLKYCTSSTNVPCRALSIRSPGQGSKPYQQQTERACTSGLSSWSSLEACESSIIASTLGTIECSFQ